MHPLGVELLHKTEVRRDYTDLIVTSSICFVNVLSVTNVSINSVILRMTSRKQVSVSKKTLWFSITNIMQLALQIHITHFGKNEEVLKVLFKLRDKYSNCLT